MLRPPQASQPPGAELQRLFGLGFGAAVDACRAAHQREQLDCPISIAHLAQDCGQTDQRVENHKQVRAVLHTPRRVDGRAPVSPGRVGCSLPQRQLAHPGVRTRDTEPIAALLGNRQRLGKQPSGIAEPLLGQHCHTRTPDD